MVTHASVPQGYTHVTANTGLARAALPRERWGGRVARGGRGPGGPARWWLSPGCRAGRAVEASSRHCRGAVEALSRRCRGAVEALPVEPVELLSSSCRACRAMSSLTPCAWASSSVEVCRGLSSTCSCRAVELSGNVELMNSCLAVEPGAYAYSFA